MKQKATIVPMHIRVCRRCGHAECPCCRNFCDTEPCVFGDDEDNLMVPRDADGDRTDRCSGPCVYDQPIDDAGYARLDALHATMALPIGLMAIRGIGVRIEWDRVAEETP